MQAMSRKNMFLAMLILIIIASVSSYSGTFTSRVVSDLTFYMGIGCGLVWLAMILTGKGKASK